MSAYQAMMLARLAGYFSDSGQDEDLRWRFVAEFLEEYRHEPVGIRRDLLEVEPRPTGDERWDVFVAPQELNVV